MHNIVADSNTHRCFGRDISIRGSIENDIKRQSPLISLHGREWSYLIQNLGEHRQKSAKSNRSSNKGRQGRVN